MFKFRILAAALLLTLVFVTISAQDEEEGVLQACQRLYYEKSYNMTVPNLHLIFEYNLEDPFEPQAIAFSTSFRLEPDWSPDATKLIFSGTVEGVSGLYIIDWEGDRVITLLYEGDVEGARWSADGTKIAFLSGYSSNNGDTELYVMNADGSEVTQVSTVPGLDLNLDWSPDGTRIIRHVETFETIGLFMTSLTGEVETEAVFTADEFERTFAPRWSPDGTQIVFTGLKADSVQLYALEVATGEVNQLTSEGNNAYGEWSPDGTQIVFVSDRDLDADQIYVMDADGANQTLVADFGSRFEVPHWSADGAWLAFSADATVYVVRPDGSELTPIDSGRDPVWRLCTLVPASDFPPGG